MQTRLLIGIVSILVAACGGSSTTAEDAQPDPYTSAVAAADAKAAEVRAIASPTPCSRNDQCSTLQLGATFNDPCGFTQDIDYSLTSASATAASAAAAEHSRLASAARALAPPLPPGTSCTGFQRFRPLACQANQCARL